ncbi:LpqB family beta-propeller domain-containing protein [Nocardioides cheoyonin]|uniref:LpqB family beta-propeller domain-containing protein n=1 Tax=Nocardioides cheoyonin TaxID=3156615 RepID=UPI0032B5D6D8
MNRPRILVAVLASLAALVALAGCGLSMPTSGSVHDAGRITAAQPDEGFELDPRPPQQGATPSEIVDGFLEAMLATPLQTTTARKYLSKELATSWNPQQETITYSDKAPARGTGPVTVDLVGANHLDEQGSWLGPVPASQRRLHFSVVREDGQWRISAAPDALVVSESWFESRFVQESLYYFDPTGRILVPTPVFVPRGSQLATALVRGLLRGPGPSVEGVVRTLLPTGVSEGLSVPVSQNGVAEVDLSGDVGQQSQHAIQLMSAQLAWTLRQERSISRIRLTIDGRPVEFSDGGDDFPVNGFAQFDPTGYASNDNLWGLRDGRLVTYDGDRFVAAGGPWGSTAHDVRAVSLSLQAKSVAGVTSDGRSVLVGPVDERGAVRRAPVSGTDLLRPQWDYANRLWLVDRTRDGARVSFLEHGVVTPVRVPGITGQDVRTFLVSRDGSRLVAVIHGQVGDRVVASRLRSDAHAQVTGGTRARVISDPAEGAIRIQALAWHSATAVVALQQLPETALIRILSVDGAAAGFASVTLTVGTPLRTLVGSPVTEDGLYATAVDGRVVDLSGQAMDIATGGTVRAVTYPG